MEFKAFASGIEQDSELFKETVHSKQSREREFIGESGANGHDAAGRVKRDVMNVHAGDAIHSQSGFGMAFFNIQADRLANTGMENTSRSPGINERFKSF